jgi:hypothetical protein
MSTNSPVRITVESLMDQARKAAGLSDFGDPWFTAPLARLVEFINEEAAIPSADAPPVLGLIGNLADRLRLVDYLKRNPEVRNEKLDVAGVIIGLPRGGSTLLQRLLGTSPQLTSTYWWEMMFPVPYPDEAPGRPAARMAAGQKAADAMMAAWPELKSIHPLEPMGYDEEIILVDRSFLSLMYSFYFDIPSYAHWQTEQDHRKGYRSRAEAVVAAFSVQHSGTTRQKVALKSPHHLLSGALQTMMDTFPDAKVLMTHRAMEKCHSSFCSNQSVTMRARRAFGCAQARTAGDPDVFPKRCTTSSRCKKAPSGRASSMFVIRK